MAIGAIIKKIYGQYNPLAILRRNRMRKALQNRTPSLLVPNCMGGILFHDLGLKFQSPTVNLMMLQRDFVKFVCDLGGYLEQELRFFKHPEYPFPCATLGDITIHFTHYATEREAREKWLERSKRLDPDNLFVAVMERDGLTKADMEALGKLNVRGIVVFTAHDYPDLPYAYYVPQCSRNGVVEDIMARSYVDDHRKYEELFDFVKWFNEAKGGDYDVSPFCR